MLDSTRFPRASDLFATPRPAQARNDLEDCEAESASMALSASPTLF
jgi:hypothetical protein